VSDAERVPGTMRYDADRQWLLVGGLVARQLADHVLAPRPKRDSRAAAFDELAGNTTLGVHLSEIAPGGRKRGHRHLDEAVIYVVSGMGWSELRQDDARPLQRIDWRAGSLLSIPVNAWHQHFNADPGSPCRQLAFKNTRLLRRLFGSREFVYANDFRFGDRYADEENYWTRREEDEGGQVRTNVILDCLDEVLRPAPEAGTGVTLQRYAMGGHLMLEVSLVEIDPAGRVAAHQHAAEESIHILSGSGRTRIWHGSGEPEEIEWRAGDLLSPPFNTPREHLADGSMPARSLSVRNVFLDLALGRGRF
jgi:quercetin dioxygenase-like cupin family protein